MDANLRKRGSRGDGQGDDLYAGQTATGRRIALAGYQTLDLGATDRRGRRGLTRSAEYDPDRVPSQYEGWGYLDY